MIILDQEKLRAYWDSIAAGFQKSPLEIVLSLLIIVLLVAVPVTLLLLKQKRDKAKNVSRALDVFREYVDRKGIPDVDQELLTNMSRFSKRGNADLPNLLTNLSLFNAASKRMIDAGETSHSRIAGLRLKLGLIQAGSKGILHSTAELAPETMVQLVAGPDRRVLAKIEAVDVHGITVRVAERIPAARSIEIRVSRPSGIYSIDSWIQSAKGDLLFLQHSEKIKRIQKRSSVRKQTRQPVVIQTDDTSAEAVRSRLLDLSAGGARIQNPGLSLERGQHLTLIMNLGTKSQGTTSPGSASVARLSAKVVRVSKNGASVSVSFDPMKAPVKEQIVKLVFQ